jgi:phospholipid/cholesterol/gamma-HCH transport system ATP-binding protein
MNNSQRPHSVKIEVRNLRKSFRAHEVLKGLSFTVERGEMFVIMGPSGSGKSVLLKHLIGLEKPDSGDILLEGEPIHQEGVMEKYRMAMVFQSGALLNSLTVGENVGLYLSEHQLLPPKEIEKVVAETLAVVELSGLEQRSVAELSGGMKKRVALARALVIEPQLILYDEPTSELDPLMAVTIGEEILKLRERTHATSIVVTHDRDLAFGLADRIAMIAEGELLFIGRPADLKRQNNPLIQRFLSAELRTTQQV